LYEVNDFKPEPISQTFEEIFKKDANLGRNIKGAICN